MRSTRIALLLRIGGIGLSVVLLWMAACRDGRQAVRLLPPTPREGDGFGNAVVLGPDELFVGAWTRAANASTAKAGMVQVFEQRSHGWSATQELTAPVRVANQCFGASLALHGASLLVGAPGWFGAPTHEDGGASRAGVVYLFERVGGRWEPRAVLRAQDGSGGDCFGYSLAFDGQRALIGAISRDHPAPDAGAVYVFERTDGVWAQVDRWVASDACAGALFGHAVALSGDTALVGAHRDGAATGMRRGAAYLFERVETESAASAWRETAKFVAPGAAEPGRTGHALAIEDGLAVVAERLRPPSGAVHVYVREAGAWRSSATLRSPSPAAREFGWSVDLDGGEILIGDHRDGGDSLGAGAAFRFVPDELGGWKLCETYRSIRPRADGGFGASVALDGGRVLVGAWNEDAAAPRSGAAYLLGAPADR
ncbi:MAG: hypothetical protein HZA52_21660 [Planctomycetes bacterium]|nr:hypothetical protein [Planctomycetota bacterium]